MEADKVREEWTVLECPCGSLFKPQCPDCNTFHRAVKRDSPESIQQIRMSINNLRSHYQAAAYRWTQRGEKIAAANRQAKIDVLDELLAELDRELETVAQSSPAGARERAEWITKVADRLAAKYASTHSKIIADIIERAWAGEGK